MWAAGVSYVAFPPYLFQLSKNGSLASLGMWHQTTFLYHTCFMCFTFLFSAHTHLFHALWPFCLSCLCLPIPHSLFLQLPFSQILSLFLSPFAPFVWPLCITRSHKDSSLFFLLTSLVSPFFPFSSLFLCAMLCLSFCTTEILFLCFPSSLVLSVSGLYYMHKHFTSKHCCPVPLNSSYTISLCYFLGRNMCPGAVFPRCQWRWLVQVHVRHVGPLMHMQVKCKTNKPWASPVPKGLGRAFWLIYDHFDDWEDNQNEYEYVLNMENLVRMPLTF